VRLKLIELSGGKWEIRDVEHNITVDTSLTPFWLYELFVEGDVLDMDTFSKEDRKKLWEIIYDKR